MGQPKTKARRNAAQSQPHHSHSLSASNFQAPTTDYDTDAFYPSDTGLNHAYQQQMQQLSQAPQGLARTTADLNLSVLRSYNPAIASIVSIAPYAVLYLWSTTKQTWDKCNMEGTLFVCALEHLPELPGFQRFVAIILNRRALGVFATLLDKADDIEFNDEFIILRVHGDLGPSAEGAGDGADPTTGAGDETEAKIYGLWVFSEAGTSTADAREHTAAIIKECASMSEKTHSEAEAALHPGQAPAEQQQQHYQNVAQATAMGRQLSLSKLFSQQREQDAGFAVHDHHSPKSGPAMPSFAEIQPQNIGHDVAPPVPQWNKPTFSNTADTDFFRGPSPYKAAAEHSGGTVVGQGNTNGNGVDLLALFKGAGAKAP